MGYGYGEGIQHKAVLDMRERTSVYHYINVFCTDTGCDQKWTVAGRLFAACVKIGYSSVRLYFNKYVSVRIFQYTGFHLE